MGETFSMHEEMYTVGLCCTADILFLETVMLDKCCFHLLTGTL